MDEHRRTNPIERTAGGRFVSSWALETRNRRMAGGGVEAAAVEVHPDPRVQRFLEQIREREIEQGIDRVRLVHATAPKTVLVLSDLVLDVTIDRTVSWGDLVATGQRVAAAMEATGGVLALSLAEAQRLHGWSERVARTLSRSSSPETMTSGQRTCSLWPEVMVISRSIGRLGPEGSALGHGSAPRAYLRHVVGWSP